MRSRWSNAVLPLRLASAETTKVLSRFGKSDVVGPAHDGGVNLAILLPVAHATCLVPAQLDDRLVAAALASTSRLGMASPRLACDESIKIVHRVEPVPACERPLPFGGKEPSRSGSSSPYLLTYLLACLSFSKVFVSMNRPSALHEETRHSPVVGYRRTRTAACASAPVLGAGYSRKAMKRSSRSARSVTAPQRTRRKTPHVPRSG